MIVVRHAKTGCLVGWLHKLPNPGDCMLRLVGTRKPALAALGDDTVLTLEFALQWGTDRNGRARAEIVVSHSAQLCGIPFFELY